MRIIGGALRGRRLSTTKGGAIRPTTDKVREAVFAILTPCLTEGTVLDLYAGTGSLGIEALSRGMRRAVFIENSPQAIALLKKNIAACALEKQSEIIRLPVARGLQILSSRKEAFDLILLDPPYRDRLVEKTLSAISEAGVITPEGVVVAEHSVKEVPAAALGTLRLDDQRHYGQTMISFFTHH